ncbi:MAG: hypothetical protein P9L88_01605 [Candidatus Tantalella remota]|nr:hypothetical protein [Candidatus Tantalella remota]
MKYRTMVELICDAGNREEAMDLAGDFLNGEVDFGVRMRTKTVALWSHRAKKYTASCIVLLVIFTSLIFKGTTLGGDEKICSSTKYGFRSTYTIMPELKTKHRSDFKKEWEKKRNEAVLDYLKK